MLLLYNSGLPCEFKVVSLDKYAWGHTNIYFYSQIQLS